VEANTLNPDVAESSRVSRIAVLPAKTVAVRTVDTAIVDIDLGFGVRVQRYVTLDSMPTIDAKLYPTAYHAMIILLGGKRLLLRTNTEQRQEMIRARVMVQDEFHPSVPGLTAIDELLEPVLCVNTFFAEFIRRGYDIDFVKSAVYRK
jgi:hypothetical protein